MKTKKNKKIFSRFFFLIAALSFLLPRFSWAQNSLRWEQAIGGPGIEYGYKVKSCLDQGYIVAGSTSSGGISDGYLVRTDSLGLVMWSKYFVGNNVDVFRSVKILPDSGFIVAGFSNSIGTHGGYDGFVERFDKNGDSLWAKFIGTGDWDFFYDVAPTYDGGFVLAGGTYGLGQGDEDIYLVKIDSIGNTIWVGAYGGTKQDEGRAIIQTGDSMLAVVGFTFSLGDSLGDSWISRLTPNGGTVWSRTAGYAGIEDKAWDLTDNYLTGRIFYCGENESVPGNGKDAYFGAFYYNGNNQFIYSTGGNLDEAFYGIASRPDGSIAAVGVDYTVGAGNGDMYFFEDYHPIWNSTNFGSAQIDVGYGVDMALDGGYISVGYTEGFNSILANVYLVKIDTSDQSTGLLSIREQPTPLSFGSTVVFPNPVQDEAVVNFDSFQSINDEIKMEVFDIAGRSVMNIPSSQWEITSSKNAKCILATNKLNDGIYQYIISDRSAGKCSGKFIVAH
ncbi:MAG: hypothetical protein HY064_04325 [Bacteroidetes bacterium]|nr:hypothetical protein [Bacteroidota bacterium]